MRFSTRRLTLPIAGLLAFGALMHACGGSSGGSSGGTPPSPAPPPPSSFISNFQFPANNAIDVPRMPVIHLGFNDQVNPATAVAPNIQLLQGLTVIPVTITYNACNNRIQVVPNAALDGGLVHTLSLTTGIQDDDAENLTALTLNFTTLVTADIERPTFTVAGFTGAPTMGNETSTVTLDWADGTDGINPVGSIQYQVFVSPQPACFTYDNPIVTTNPGDTTADIPGLEPRTLYSFVVRAIDASGNQSLNTNVVNVTTYTSFLLNVMPIVTQSCNTCHNPPNGQAWLSTPSITMDYSTPGSVYASWVGVNTSWQAPGWPTRVVAGDAANSFLWNKISAAVPAAGAQMPFAQAALEVLVQDVFFDWIEQGALNN